MSINAKMAFFLTSISKDKKPNVMACAWAAPVMPLHLGGSRIVYFK